MERAGENIILMRRIFALLIVLSVLLGGIAFAARVDQFPAGIKTLKVNEIYWAKPTYGAGTTVSPYTHADNTAGISTALGLANIVKVQDGNYTISTTIQIGDYETLDGYGADLTVLKCASGLSPCLSIGDTTHAVTTSYARVKNLSVECTGLSAGQACVQWNATRYSHTENVHTSLTSCSGSIAVHFNSAKLGGAVGGNWRGSVISDHVYAGGTGDNYGIKLDGDGSTYSTGRTNTMNFYDTNIQGGKYPLYFGPSWNNRFYGIAIEQIQKGSSTQAITFEDYSSTNVIYGWYGEPKLDDDAFEGSMVWVSDNNTINDGNVTTKPVRNIVYDFFPTGASGTYYDSLVLSGSNYVYVGNTAFGGSPDEDGIVGKSWPHQVRAPGEQYARTRMGLTGIGVGDGTETPLPMLLTQGGPASKQGSFVVDANPDLSVAHSFFIGTFNANSHITAFNNAVESTDVLIAPQPTSDGLTLTFTDTNATGITHEFYLYPDDNAYDDNVTITGVGTGTTVVTFAQSAHRYPMWFKGYYDRTNVIFKWYLQNRVASAPFQFRPGNGYTLQAGSGTAWDPANATTYHIGGFPSLAPAATGAGDNVKIYIPRSGTLRAAYVHFYQTASAGADTSTISFRLNGSDTTISSSVVNNAGNTVASNTNMSVPVVQGDTFTLKWVTPTWTGTPLPTSVRTSATLYIE
jgi:hypothetical protein